MEWCTWTMSGQPTHISVVYLWGDVCVCVWGLKTGNPVLESTASETWVILCICYKKGINERNIAVSLLLRNCYNIPIVIEAWHLSLFWHLCLVSRESIERITKQVLPHWRGGISLCYECFPLWGKILFFFCTFYSTFLWIAGRDDS